MQYSFALFGALAVLPAARCIAFGGPAPTLAHLLHERQEYTPVPTKAPSAAKLHHKRIFEDAPYDHCGWIDGDEGKFRSPVVIGHMIANSFQRQFSYVLWYQYMYALHCQWRWNGWLLQRFRPTRLRLGNRLC